MIKINLNILKKCSSTNDVAINKAYEGLPEGSSYLSYLQLKGRGRNDKKWESLNGNLFLSTIFRPSNDRQNWHQLSLIVGYSVLEVLSKLGVDRNKITIKWPNDVLVEGKKISGVLLEAFDSFIVAGIGININKTPKNDCKWYTTKLIEHSNNYFSLKQIANMLLEKVFKNYYIWTNRGFVFFKEKINNNLNNINKKIIVNLNSNLNDVSGIFVGLGENGSLKIKVDDKYFEYYSVENFFFPNKV